MNTAITEIFWAGLHNLVYSVPLIALVVVLVVYRLKKLQRATALLTANKHHKHLLQNFSYSKNVLSSLLFSVAFVFVSLALLQPQWDKKEENIDQEGRDLFIALDISRSMLAKDCMPNRLECAKAKIKELVKRLSSERVGLVLFSGSAFIQCPLTSDYAAFFMFLDQVDVESISSGTTAFDHAIKKVIDAFNNGSDRKNKLVVLFTDGEDFSSNLATVKQEASRIGLHIFTFGVGTDQGAPIPLFDAYGKQIGHQLDKKGSVVISRLNEGILNTLAHDSGGMFVQMQQDDSDLRTLIKYVTSFEKEKISQKTISRLQEQYPYVLAIGFILLVIQWLL